MAMLGVLVLLIIAIAANIVGDKAGVGGVLFGGGRPTTWFVTMALFAAMFATAGYAIRSRWDGVFIDRDNRISLSRFQLIAWTVLLISALFTAGLSNAMPVSSPTPLLIDIPEQVWALLGLGAFSAVAAPAIKDGKRADSAPAPAAALEHEAIATAFEADQNVTGHFDGHVFVKTTPQEARWIDLILGDYEGVRHVDVSKLQQLAFTVLLIVIYTMGIWDEMASLTDVVSAAGIKGKIPAAITAFPDIDGGFVALLAISHAAYLADKQIAKT